MLSLKKSISLHKRQQTHPTEAEIALFTPLSLAKAPRESHSKLVAVIKLLARQAARQEFMRQFPAKSGQTNIGRDQ